MKIIAILKKENLSILQFGIERGAGTFHCVPGSFVDAKAKRRQYKRMASVADKVNG